MEFYDFVVFVQSVIAVLILALAVFSVLALFWRKSIKINAKKQNEKIDMLLSQINNMENQLEEIKKNMRLLMQKLMKIEIESTGDKK